MNTTIPTHRSPLWKRALCASLAAVMLAGSTAVSNLTASSGSYTVSAEDSVDDLRAQKDALAAQQAELETKKNESAQTLEEKQAEKDVLQQQIDVKTQEISVNQQLIDQLDTKIEDKTFAIAKKEQEVAAKEAQIEDRFQELRQRLRAISKSGTLSSSLQMLMNTSNYTDYLLQSKVMELVSESDQALMDDLEGELQGIQDDKKSLEADKAELAEERKPVADLQTDLQLKKSELDSLYSQVNVIVEQLNADIGTYNAAIAESEAMAAALQDQIDELIRTTIGSGNAFLSGTMYWPAPTALIISSTFKYRWGKYHTGVDICGSSCYGEPIVAAADGVVIDAGNAGDGYGNKIILDNGTDSAGQRIMTLYGHASSLAVSVGDIVSAGQTIAYIGSTGNSTGPHLHFEVRVDGSAVDPLSGYLSTNGITIDESL